MAGIQHWCIGTHLQRLPLHHGQTVLFLPLLHCNIILLLGSSHQHLITGPYRLCHSVILSVVPSANVLPTTLQDYGMAGWKHAQLCYSWSFKHRVQP